MDDLSVAEAAQALGISSRRVRALLASGNLPGRRVGGRWLLSSHAVEARRGRPRESGRPLSHASAWNILAVLSGAEGSLSTLPAPVRSRARRRAIDIRKPDQLAAKWPLALASRARSCRFYGHPDVLADVLSDPRVVRSGVSAAGDHNADLIASGDAEGYVRTRDAVDLAAEYALNPDVDDAQANVLLHVVEDEAPAQWLFRHSVAPAPVVAADLAERESPRDREAGLRLAARL